MRHLWRVSTVLLIMVLTFFRPQAGALAQESVPQLGEASIEEVVQAMTLEEKAAFVIGTGMAGFDNPEDASVQLVPGAAGQSYAIPRLGIPPMVLADGPAGLRISPTRTNDPNTYYCTAFPIATLMASTWDTDVVYQVGQATGKEVLEYGVDILLSPALNIHRNPLCGRNFEYYSEDPLLSGTMAGSMSLGVQSQGVGTTLKHFVANNSETNRMSIDTHVDQRTLREMYLRNFKYALEEGSSRAMMSSYNRLNGTYTSQNPDLLTSILRNDWGFDGFVMSDWFAGDNAVEQMRAQNDMVMPGNPDQVQAIINAVEEGLLDEALLDRNVTNILEVQVKTPRFQGYNYSNVPDLDAHALAARHAATEGMVLLKNEAEALPIPDSLSVAAFGNASYDVVIGGTGSGDVNEAYSVSIDDGLSIAGYTLDTELEQMYPEYIRAAKAELPEPEFLRPPPPIDEMSVSQSLIRRKARENDIALITIGRLSGEFEDRSLDGDYYLTETELNLIQDVTNEFHSQDKKVVVVLNIGGVIEVASWRDQPDAILLAWQAGQETGNAVADIIRGDVTPSGKLATTFPMDYDDVPSSEFFPGTPEDDPTDITYKEGIYVGYRYYLSAGVETAYEFGYGLSYTDFEYSNFELGADQFTDHMTVSVDVTNTGAVPGKEVAQVYLSAPANDMHKPVRELKDFGKTRLLQPGDTQTLQFELRSMDLASFDSDASAWVAEAGEYEVLIGASSEDIKDTATFNLSQDRTVEQVNDVLEPQMTINPWEF